MIQLQPVVNSNDHILGNTEAGIELVEYGDYQCPYCGLAYPIIKEIKKDFGKNIKFVFRNFPLTKVHPQALAAAIATEAAGLQNKFWEMHDLIFENQKELQREQILRFAKAVGLNMEQFKKDIEQKDLADKVEMDFESGIRSGVNRTPSFFINGEKYEGDWDGGQLYQYLRSKVTNLV